MIPVFVKPNEGARVRQPERGSTVMAAEGGWVPRNVFYEGLIQQGDIIVVDPQPELPKQTSEPIAAPSPPVTRAEPDLSQTGIGKREPDASLSRPADKHTRR